MHENESEQAAAMILWGLFDRPVGIITINEHSCEGLDAGYRTSTGQPPLHERLLSRRLAFEPSPRSVGPEPEGRQNPGLLESMMTPVFEEATGP